jgi:hypothetical protein
VRTDASDRLAALLKIKRFDIGYETERALDVAADEIERLRAALELCSSIVEAQAKDEGLWFIAQTMPEAYLQKALRLLHATIEGKSMIARTALEKNRPT